MKSTAVVGFFTILSRIGGFVRDALMLAILGASPVLDAFIVAFKFPNFFRRISAEGAFSAAFVPLYSATLAGEGAQIANHFARQAFTVMALILAGFVLSFELFTPSLMALFAPGFSKTPERMDLAIQFTRVTFPYIFFISLASLMGGVLNSLGRFAAWSAAPILLNVMMIVSLVFLAPFLGSHGHALAWGVFFSGIAQFALLWWSLYRLHVPMHFEKVGASHKIKTLFQKMLPGVVGAGVFQINVFVDIWIGSFLAVGSLTYLHAADRLNQLPLSVIGIAISTAFLPSLSKHFRLNEVSKAHQEFSKAFSYAVILTMPAACALFVLAFPISKILFQRGAFVSADTLATASTLQAFVIGLPAYVLAKVLSTGFFARQNTHTPVIIGSICVFANFALNLLFMKHFHYVGIALATSLSSWLNVILLGGRLQKEGLPVLSSAAWRMLAQVGLCCALMAAVLIPLSYMLHDTILMGGGLAGWAGLTALVAAGGGVYLACAHFLKLLNMRQLLQIMKGKRRRV